MLHTHPPPFSLPRHSLLDRLNGPWHERALWLYMAVVLAHWIEHLAQAIQIFSWHWPRPHALGILGLWVPWLVSSEILHFGYALFMVTGLIVLRPGFLGRARFWWQLALAIQTWHFSEHSLLQLQAITGHYWFGAAVPTSILQLWVPRPELHLLYNAAVFTPMVGAMYAHLYPPAHEPGARCRCSRTCNGSGERTSPYK